MLSIDGSALVVFAIIWVLVFILTRVFFNPLRKIRAERERHVRRGEEEAQSSQAEYDRALQKIDQAVRQAKAEAEQARDHLAAEAGREKNQMIAELNAEYRRQVDQAKSEIAAQMASLKKEVASRSDDLAEKIEGRLLN